jgi:YHS domain-containing protein
MSVPVAGARWSAEHDGVRYVFCGPGCRDRFAEGPAAVVRDAGSR